MKRIRNAILILMVSAAAAASAAPSAPEELEDLYFGEALYYAFQEDWFETIARLDTELTQYRELDEPERDTLYAHIDQAEFDVGDFELAYRMHRRAGRAITAVIEGNVGDSVRNEALFRLARIFFHKDQPVEAQRAIERIRGAIPAPIRNDLNFLSAQILMANGRYSEAATILRGLQDVKELEGFTTYNLGIAFIRDGRENEGRQALNHAGQIDGTDVLTASIKDKANLVLGSKLLDEKDYQGAKQVLDRVRLSGPFSNRALLASGWADAFQGRFDRALVPWATLVTRDVTEASVQEAMLAVPYAYTKLKGYSTAAAMYGAALNHYGAEVDKLTASIRSIRSGYFLQALVRDELKQDRDWVVRLRALPKTPETYYLLDLMASHDFQESLKNYRDLEQLRGKLAAWERDLDAFEDIIAQRRSYYEPLLPEIDKAFRQLDSQMRLRLEQRDRIDRRLASMVVLPRPDYLATATERLIGEEIGVLERRVAARGAGGAADLVSRLHRLRGVVFWNVYTQYDRRFSEAYRHLMDLNHEVDLLRTQYDAFVRTRQAATQSYQGYDLDIHRQRTRVRKARKKVEDLMARQGHGIETLAVKELTARRERLEALQIKARFAMADSYDRATRAQAPED